MADVVNIETIGLGLQKYSIKNLVLPNAYQIIIQELAMPNSWSNYQNYIRYGQDIKDDIFNDKKLEEYYMSLLDSALKDKSKLLTLFCDIIGYGRINRVHFYKTLSPKIADITKHMDKNDWESKVENYRPQPNLIPKDYTIKRQLKSQYLGGGYYAYKQPLKPKKPKYEDVKKEKKKKDYSIEKFTHFVNPYKIKLKRETKNIDIISPNLTGIISNELNVFLNPYFFSSLTDNTKIVRDFIDQRVNYPSGYPQLYDDVEIQKQKDIFKESPLLKRGFFNNMFSTAINRRDWNRYVNRGRNNLEDCNMPEVHFPKRGTPFILINNFLNIWSPWDETGMLEIYIIFGEISRKNYMANIKKYEKHENHKKHIFLRDINSDRRGKLKNWYFNKERFFIGNKITISDHEFDSVNFIGPIENPMHPQKVQNSMGDWEEDNEYPIGSLFFNHKIIELSDITPKIVNWPRNKPVKVE